MKRYDEGGFISLLHEIEELLGQLGGREAVYEWMTESMAQANKAWDSGSPTPTRTGVTWRPPDANGFDWVLDVFDYTMFTSAGDTPSSVFTTQATAAYHAGRVERDVVGTVLDTVDRLRRLDPDALHEASTRLNNDVGMACYGLIGESDALLNQTLQHWEGGAQASFEAYHTTFTERLNAYSQVALIAAAALDGMAGMVRAAQDSMMTFVTHIRDKAEAAVKDWTAHCTYTPQSWDFNDYLNLANTAMDVVGLLPSPVTKIGKAALEISGDVLTALNVVNGAVGDPEQVAKTADTWDATRADDYWSKLVITTSTKYDHEVMQALDVISFEKTYALRQWVEEFQLWFPPSPSTIDHPKSWWYNL